MDDALPQPIDYDTSGRIDQDLSCLKCGYNLRGLSSQQICPECGEPAAQTIRGDWLEFSDPKWVRRLACGMRCIIWTIFGTPFLSFAILVIGERPFVAIMVSAYIVAFWLITSPEPGRTDAEPGLGLRRIARYGSIFGVLMACLLGMAGLGDTRITSTMKAAPGSVFVWAAWFLILGYAARLARRIPDVRLARHSRLVVRRGAVTGAAGTILGAISVAVWYLAPAVSAKIDVAMTVCIVIPWGTMTLLLFWSIKLVFDFRKRFRATAEAAQNRSCQAIKPSGTHACR